ncbi:MAG: DUF2442 domain-containing protein [Bacteroidota bacterium]
MYDAPFLVVAEPHDDHTLTLTFATSEKRQFDATPLLDTPAFASLRDLDTFARVKVVYGSLEWPGERDLAHDMLYARSTPMPVSEAA